MHRVSVTHNQHGQKGEKGSDMRRDEEEWEMGRDWVLLCKEVQ